MMAFTRIENLTDTVPADPKRRANVERERREAVGGQLEVTAVFDGERNSS